MSSLTNYAENKIIDWLLRGQSLVLPGTWYVGLLTAAPSDSSAGTEASGTDYARVGITADLANFSGTQSAGSTTLSSGTGGTSYNNAELAFPTPGGDWGEVSWAGLYDASSGGNLWAWCALNEVKSIFTNDIVVIPIASLSFQIDN